MKAMSTDYLETGRARQNNAPATTCSPRRANSYPRRLPRLEEVAEAAGFSRTTAVADLVLDRVQETEPQQRAKLRLSLGNVPHELPLRQGRVIAWFLDALTPMAGEIGNENMHQLALALRAASGIETRVWLTVRRASTIHRWRALTSAGARWATSGHQHDNRNPTRTARALSARRQAAKCAAPASRLSAARSIWGHVETRPQRAAPGSPDPPGPSSMSSCLSSGLRPASRRPMGATASPVTVIRSGPAMQAGDPPARCEDTREHRLKRLGAAS